MARLIPFSCHLGERTFASAICITNCEIIVARSHARSLVGRRVHGGDVVGQNRDYDATDAT